MAAKLGGSGGGKYHVEQNADINVTPFVDIMLVLLIIFMVASSVATVSVEVKLPIAVAKAQENPPTPVFISVTTDGSVYIGDGQTSFENLGSDLSAQIGRRDPTARRDRRAAGVPGRGWLRAPAPEGRRRRWLRRPSVSVSFSLFLARPPGRLAPKIGPRR